MTDENWFLRQENNRMKIMTSIKISTLVLILVSLFIYCPPEVPDSTPPQVVIMYPVNGQVVSGEVRITVGATDNEELDKINLFIDGVHVHTVSDPLLEYTWDTRPIADNRDHSMHATASDKEGNNGFSGSTIVRVMVGELPDTLAPVITILNPVGGSFVSDTVQVVPQIFDDSPISKVDYFVDGILNFTTTEEPFEYQWVVTQYINGSSHNLFARAFDINMNNSVSNIVTVTIANVDNIAPTATILYPSAGTTFNDGDTVNIIVDAQDNVGIQKVLFYIDGQLKLTDTSEPYEYPWDTSGLGDGRSHTIYVKAYDFVGNTGVQLITVIVNP